MKPLRELAAMSAEKETALNARMFVHAAKYIALSKGSKPEAYTLAKQARALPPIVEVLQKAAADTGTSAGWGASLMDSGLADAFLSSLRTVSIFDAALPFMPRVPFRTTVRVVTTGATGATINEAMTKPVTKLSLSASAMSEQKTLAIVAITESLLRETNARIFQFGARRRCSAGHRIHYEDHDRYLAHDFSWRR